MVAKPQKHYSPEEYLALEETAEYRSEYYRGEIFAMSGGSANHNRIAKNLLIALDAALEGKPCEAFITDMRLLVKKNGLYTYPVTTQPLNIGNNGSKKAEMPYIVVLTIGRIAFLRINLRFMSI